MCFFPVVHAQSIWQPGYSGNIEIGVIVQKFPYASISFSSGKANERGLFFGGGVLFETPIAVDPRFDVNPIPAPGPFEKDKMLGVFAEVKCAFYGSETVPSMDLKVGPEYNLDSKRFQNIFIRPTVGLCYKQFSVSLGTELTWGEYVQENMRKKSSISPDIIIGGYWKILPYVGVMFIF